MTYAHHSFHIPVMGTAFSIDTPFKVAHYGINSVLSIGDDMLLERIRKMYCDKFNLPYAEIDDKAEDSRAKRITSYLNLIKDLVEKRFQEMKNAGLNAALTEKGVKHAASLWRAADGTPEEFIQLCTSNFVSDPAKKEATFNRFSD